MRPLGLFGISCFALMIAGAWGTQFRSGLARLVTPAGPAEPRPPTSSLPAIVAQALSCSTPITLDGCRFDVRSRNPPSGSIGVKIVCDNVRANSAAQPLDLIGQALTMTLPCRVDGQRMQSQRLAPHVQHIARHIISRIDTPQPISWLTGKLQTARSNHFDRRHVLEQFRSVDRRLRGRQRLR
jgi:hypothetical protein